MTTDLTLNAQAMTYLDKLSGPAGAVLAHGGNPSTFRWGIRYAQKLAHITGHTLDDILDLVRELHD